MKSIRSKAAGLILTALLLGTLSACRGATGPAGPSGPIGPAGQTGPSAVDHGSIAGSVKDSSGSPLAAVSISTDPVTIAVQTDNSGLFTLSSIPIGAFTVIATKSGFGDAFVLDVGVAAAATTRVGLVLSPNAPTSGALSGTIFGRKGAGTSEAIAGAKVCIEGGSLCTTSVNDGSFSFPALPPGPVFVSATATGFLPGETRQAASVVAGAIVKSVDVTLSGKPTDASTYVGSTTCVGCHGTQDPGLVAAWKASAHYTYTVRALDHVDVTGWPLAPSGCSAPAVAKSGVSAADPANSLTVPVLLVRWAANCGASNPRFSMAFDANGNGQVDPGETVIAIMGTFGGVATEAGQCGNGGFLPANVPCGADFGGTGASAVVGWWQQEYLTAIGPASKPSWVSWDTTNTPTDVLTLPLAWNQRSAQWVNAPDYNPTQAGTFSAACGACHEAGISLKTDSNGNVTSYSSVDPVIGCEKCHGPGSAHAGAGGDAQLIVNPKYLTAQSAREACGQCHTNAVTSVSPAGLGYAFNSQASVGGGNFIPGVHVLSDFLNITAYGDPSIYWPSGFPNIDHAQYQDMSGSAHANNNYEKVTCDDCHDAHGGTGGPNQFQRDDPQSGDQYVFQANQSAVRDDVSCLGCHAAHGSFAAVALADVARYHVSAGGSALKNGSDFNPTAADQAASASLVASAVNAHMSSEAAMPAYFDPLGAAGTPTGRCSSCHMAKTAFTAQFYAGTDDYGRTANVIGDVTAHTLNVAMPQDSLDTWSGATTWDAVMPNACGACHADYRFGK
jgi:hypothetical protein